MSGWRRLALAASAVWAWRMWVYADHDFRSYGFTYEWKAETYLGWAFLSVVPPLALFLTIRWVYRGFTAPGSSEDR